MDLLTLAKIDEELDSNEVKELCFLCLDVIPRKRLEMVKTGKDLFLRLEEQGLNTHNFISELLRVIRRADLYSILETDSRTPEETHVHPTLSNYRMMLYEIYQDMTHENFEKMKFLLSNRLGRRPLEACTTALDVFSEMEKTSYLSDKKLDDLHTILLQCDQQLALTVQHYREGFTEQHQATSASHSKVVDQTYNHPEPAHVPFPATESTPQSENIFYDAQPDTQLSPIYDQKEYYSLTHNPRGVCMIFNNETFVTLSKRRGSDEDAKALEKVFSWLGFTIQMHKNLTAKAMRHQLEELGKRKFSNDDALVVCVLSHGELSCVFGTDGEKVFLQELTQPFTSGRAPTLVKKPKLFFIQACQGDMYQKGAIVKFPPKLEVEEDAGPDIDESVAWDADFLLGMSTVPNCRSFRSTMTGSIYIQVLCKQLELSAERSGMDILSVLTHVNKEVSTGVFKGYKQMPEPKYTLTKKLVLKPVDY
ncbi:caspase-8 [Thalassophryne amazonica]|uniref:caspase-8 n=1 Tax=Thalassophryne amazonica TaxID=390379 RepID=UPI0014709C7D|nr:caspase-8 [Thalassophryne amazonica]XP_034039542.1 caspase-8 [Thalassophryne amazonica]